MNTRSIEVVGTSQGYWTQWVTQLLPDRLIDVCNSARPDFDQSRRKRLGTNVLALFEHPAIGLARLLAQGQDIDPEAWIDDWLSSAQDLLGYVQRNPEHTLMVNAEDVRRRPRRLAQLLQSRWGGSIAMPSRLASTQEEDALSTALAWGFVEREAAVQGLLPELLENCTPLPGVRASKIPPDSEYAVDGVAAAGRLSELLSTARKIEHLVGEHRQEVSELRAAVARCADLDANLQALEADRDDLRARCESVAAELVAANRHLQIAKAERGELSRQVAEATRLQEALRADLAAARDQAVLVNTRLESTESALAQAKHQRQVAIQDLAQATHEVSVLEGNLAEVREERCTLEQELRSARQALHAKDEECDVTLKHLHALRAELEQNLHSRRVAEAALSAANESLDTANHRLSKAESELARASQELNELRQERDRAIVHQQALERELAQAKRDRTASEQEMTKARARGAALEREVAQSTRARDDLERNLAEVRESSAAIAQELAKARETERLLRAQVAQAEERNLHLAGELDRAKQAASTAAEEGDLLLTQLHRAQSDLEALLSSDSSRRPSSNASPPTEETALTAELRKAREECELLTLQTHQVQQELARVHAEKVRLSQEIRNRPTKARSCDISIGEVVLFAERDTPPHREISFIVRDIQKDGTEVPEASVRLVEHWGRPGLALFKEEGRPAILDAWKETGREDDRPFMLLIHGEDSTQIAYDAMTTSDWQLVQDLVERIAQALSEQTGSVSPGWLSLAQRLQLSLHEQPPRLRHSHATIRSLETDGAAPDGLELSLKSVSYLNRSWRRLSLRWYPTGSVAALELLLDTEDGPPLLTWPADQNGTPAKELRLPLSDDPSAPEARAAWSGLSGTDRDFVAQILALLPGIAQEAVATSAADSHTPTLELEVAATKALQIGLTALQLQGVRTQRAPRRRPLLERMAHRLGVNAPSTPSNPIPTAALEG